MKKLIYRSEKRRLISKLSYWQGAERIAKIRQKKYEKALKQLEKMQ